MIRVIIKKNKIEKESVFIMPDHYEVGIIDFVRENYGTECIFDVQKLGGDL